VTAARPHPAHPPRRLLGLFHVFRPICLAACLGYLRILDPLRDECSEAGAPPVPIIGLILCNSTLRCQTMVTQMIDPCFVFTATGVLFTGLTDSRPDHLFQRLFLTGGHRSEALSEMTGDRFIDQIDRRSTERTINNLEDLADLHCLLPNHCH